MATTQQTIMLLWFLGIIEMFVIIIDLMVPKLTQSDRLL